MARFRIEEEQLFGLSYFIKFQIVNIFNQLREARPRIKGLLRHFFKRTCPCLVIRVRRDMGLGNSNRVFPFPFLI
jgi:hypothetical protein